MIIWRVARFASRISSTLPVASSRPCSMIPTRSQISASSVDDVTAHQDRLSVRRERSNDLRAIRFVRGDRVRRLATPIRNSGIMNERSPKTQSLLHSFAQSADRLVSHLTKSREIHHPPQPACSFATDQSVPVRKSRDTRHNSYRRRFRSHPA